MHATEAARRYLEFLAARDGDADFARHTLARREAFFAALARDPVGSRQPVDRAVYLRNLARRRPEDGLDDRMLWLLATAKPNQAERFAVGLAELYGRIRDDSEPVEVHLTLQETYHTRILADVVAMFGLPVHARPPVVLARAMIRWMISMPPVWRLPVTACGEMVGCVLFRALRDRGLALCADEPAVAERVRLLYDEILADEISHVGFVASQLGPVGRAVARSLYRLLAPRLVAQMPEVVQLLGRAELARRFDGFRLDEMARDYPRLAFTVATI
jgi:hypothetical protein